MAGSEIGDHTPAGVFVLAILCLRFGCPVLAIPLSRVGSHRPLALRVRLPETLV